MILYTPLFSLQRWRFGRCSFLALYLTLFLVMAAYLFNIHYSIYVAD